MDRLDGNFLLGVSEALPKRSDEELARFTDALRCNGLRLLERDAKDIKREPLFSNVCEIWSHERYHVPLMDRLRIQPHLTRDRSRSSSLKSGLAILTALCALACANLVELNIQNTPLRPRSTVLGR